MFKPTNNANEKIREEDTNTRANFSIKEGHQYLLSHRNDSLKPIDQKASAEREQINKATEKALPTFSNDTFEVYQRQREDYLHDEPSKQTKSNTGSPPISDRLNEYDISGIPSKLESNLKINTSLPTKVSNLKLSTHLQSYKMTSSDNEPSSNRYQRKYKLFP